MKLSLKQCVVRPWQIDDAPSLVRHANSRNVWLSVRDLFPHPYTPKDAETYLGRVTTEQPCRSFCIEINGSAAGGIGIRPGNDVARYSAELGYWLGEAFWGRGIMTEVVPAFSDYCFANFPFFRLEAYTFANNPASARVLEKSGYVLEGRLKNSVVQVGQILDSVLYAKIITPSLEPGAVSNRDDSGKKETKI